MNCSKCNAEIPAESKFCPTCGNKVEQTTNKRFCTNCGSALAEGILFCPECGTSAAAQVQAEPVAPVQTAETVQQPVMAAAPVSAAPVTEPVVSAIPMPVNDVPTASAVPMPVNDVQAQPVSAIPTPVNDVAAQQAAFVASAAVTAPANQQVDLNKSGQTTPVADFSGMPVGAAAVAATPKKKSKIGLWIGLGIGAVVIAAAAVVGLCFRGVATNLVVGNNKYASIVEGESIKAVSNNFESAVDQEVFTERSSEAMNTAMSIVSTMSESGFEGDVEDVSSLNLEQMISAMYSAMMETTGVNYAEYIIDADIQLTDAGKSAMGLEGEEMFDEIIDHINKGELKFACTFAEDSLDAYVAVTDGTGFTMDAKGIVCSDGTVAVMFPFGTSKCIGVKLDVNGEVQQVEEVEFKVDQKEVDRLVQEIIDIYLSYVEKGKADVKGDAQITAGGITEKGRLVTVELSPENIEQMFAEIVTHIANDAYFVDLMTEYSTEMGLDYDAEYYKQNMLDSVEDIEGSVEIAISIETLVDNNGNILAKSYIAKNADASSDDDEEYEDDDIADMMDIDDEYYFEYGVEEGDVEEIKVTIISKDDVSVFAVFADDEELMSAKAQKKNETDGSVRLVVNDDGMTVSLNIDYEGVKYEKYFNTEILVGKFTVYTAGTEESLPEGSSYKMILDSSVSGKEYTSKISVEVEPYGTFGFSAKMIGDNVTAEKIPGDAYIIVDPENVSEDAAIESAEYVQGMLEDIKSVLEKNSSSPLASVMYDGVVEGIAYFDDILNPKADYDAIVELADEMYEMCDQLSTAYNDNYKIIPDELFEEMDELYINISDLSDELNNSYEDMDIATFTEIENKYQNYKVEANNILAEVEKLAEEAKENSVSDNAVVGMYDIDIVYLYGEEYNGSDIYEYYTIDIKEDGTFVMDSEGDIEEGTWSVVGNTLYAEDDYDNIVTFTIENDRLIYDDETMDFSMEFVKR